MKIYTKTGDAGETGLLGGPRVRKDAPCIEAYGTVDELNALLGTARALGLPGPIDEVVAQAQHDLFAIGAQLA
ncbi:MAG: ATP:cob(I)alamin adenosyltransferase, partial [Planctomycetales bacterium]|nr:ATP:cob(I)alamin adenosyltransferase [Planctomycetales bacterium]